MDDLISRQVAIDTLAMADARKGWKSLKFSEIHKILLELPPAQPNRGKWVQNTRVEPIYEIDGLKTCQCSRCTFTAIAVDGFGCYNYCPNCGADMRVGGDAT